MRIFVIAKSSMVQQAMSLEATVNVLLQVGERVVEVSRDKIMVRIWDRDNSKLSAFKSHYEGKHISEIRNDSTITRCMEGIDEAFATGRNCYVEYVSHHNDVAQVLTLSLRVLACHPDKENFVFLVIENITRGNEHILVEDKWKLALDASDQGVWDANFENGTLYFSDKWQELFGYSAKEITTLAEWTSKIYPDDAIVSQKKFDNYIAGKTPTYSAQIRFRCKDDSYRWILSRGVIIERMPDGSPKRFIGAHTDISELKKAE
jgi:PAS domain S-box-containing protein